MTPGFPPPCPKHQHRCHIVVCCDASLKMPKNMFQAYLDKQPRRYPDLYIRPATTCDFPQMARMASKVFQHERDLDYFDKHRRVKMAEEAEADWIDNLLKREREWRHSELRLHYDTPGRHFILATYTKKPAKFMTVRRRRAQAREEILGWAEWQDPGQTPAPPGNPRAIRGFPGLTPAELDTAIRDLALVHRRMPLLVLPNGLSVNMFDALRSFDRAATENHKEWGRWSTGILPMCLGQDGDVDGKNLGMFSSHSGTASFRLPSLTKRQSSVLSSSTTPIGTTSLVVAFWNGACIRPPRRAGPSRQSPRQFPPRL